MENGLIGMCLVFSYFVVGRQDTLPKDFVTWFAIFGLSVLVAMITDAILEKVLSKS